MFKSLFEKPSRAQVQSVRKHNHLVGRQWLLITEGKSEGELVPATFFGELSCHSIFSEEVRILHLRPPPPWGLFSFPPPGPGPWHREGCGQWGLLFTSIISVGVGQAWPEKDRRENPFRSAEWGLHIPLCPHDNSQHLAVKKKMPILGFFCSTLDCEMG